MATVYLFRRKTAADWTSQNPVLMDGELGLETDTGKFKFGNGSSGWNARPYAGASGGAATWGAITGTLSTQADLQAALNAKQATLISGTNIKTINGNHILGSGDLVISGGGGGVSDGDKGDITVSGGGATWTIDAGAVGLTKVASTVLDRANHTGTQAAGTITGLAAIATSGSASDLTAGTLPAAQFDDTAHGNRAGGTLHPAATTSVAGFMSAADKTKLDAITGTNTGDQTITLTGVVTGSGTGSFATSLGSFTKAQLDAAVSDGNVLYVGDVTSNATHTGDATGATALTLATVNSNVGAFGSATQVATFTVNGKGLTTAAANVAISIPATAISDSTAAGRSVLTAASATAQTALFDLFTSGAKGLAPASGGGTTNFLRADGTWAAPPGGGGSSLTVQDEGVTLSTAVTSINFTGAGVTATGTTSVTVNVPGGGSGGLTRGQVVALAADLFVA